MRPTIAITYDRHGTQLDFDTQPTREAWLIMRDLGFTYYPDPNSGPKGYFQLGYCITPEEVEYITGEFTYVRNQQG